jgi:SAM-dependent methyltransferase
MGLSIKPPRRSRSTSCAGRAVRTRNDCSSSVRSRAISACAIGYVDDLGACLREVFRVLKPGGMFLLSGGHPIGYVFESGSRSASRSYFEVGKRVEGHETGCPFASVHRTLSDYFGQLVASGFVVDRMLEPDSRVRYPSDPWFGLWDSTADRLSLVPGTFIFRARKLPAMTGR